MSALGRRQRRCSAGRAAARAHRRRRSLEQDVDQGVLCSALVLANLAAISGALQRDDQLLQQEEHLGGVCLLVATGPSHDELQLRHPYLEPQAILLVYVGRQVHGDLNRLGTAELR